MGNGLAYVDGTYCRIGDATMSPLDLGFTHSDVVYDVVSTWKGQFFRLDDHISRFMNSCAATHLTCPHLPGELKRILATCVNDGGVCDASYVAMVQTRGRYSKKAEATRDIFKTRPTFIAYAVPYVSIATAEEQSRGLHLIVAKTPRIPDICMSARIKSYHWGDLTQGKFEARATGADGAVHCSIDGFLTEGAGFNVFFCKGGQLFTPARNVLEGVTRQSVLDLATEFQVRAEVGDYMAEQLRQADEAFVTTTAGGIIPVVRIDGRSLGKGVPGVLSSKLRAEYWRKREEGWLGTTVDGLLNSRTA
jgi:branched-chain amino acid aminotransferase